MLIQKVVDGPDNLKAAQVPPAHAREVGQDNPLCGRRSSQGWTVVGGLRPVHCPECVKALQSGVRR